MLPPFLFLPNLNWFISLYLDLEKNISYNDGTEQLELGIYSDENGR